MKNYRNDDAKRYALDGLMLAIGLAAVAFLSSGCSGMEVGGKVGLYRVDTHAERSETYRRAVPLRCYFTSCAPESEEVQGS